MKEWTHTWVQPRQSYACPPEARLLHQAAVREETDVSGPGEIRHSLPYLGLSPLPQLQYQERPGPAIPRWVNKPQAEEVWLWNSFLRDTWGPLTACQATLKQKCHHQLLGCWLCRLNLERHRRSHCIAQTDPSPDPPSSATSVLRGQWVSLPT